MITGDHEAAYAAGILDGEGSVSMSRVGGKQHEGKRYWRIVVSVSNCDLRLIEWLQVRWAGAVLAGMDRGPTRRVQHRWTVVGNPARGFLATVRPFLLIKGERVDWALEVLDIQATRLKNRHLPYTEREQARLAELRSMFDDDKTRSWAARGRKWDGE